MNSIYPCTNPFREYFIPINPVLNPVFRIDEWVYDGFINPREGFAIRCTFMNPFFVYYSTLFFYSVVPFSSGMDYESGIRPFPSRFSHSHCATDIRQLSRPRGVQLTLHYQDTSSASPHSDVAIQQLFRL